MTSGPPALERLEVRRTATFFNPGGEGAHQNALAGALDRHGVATTRTALLRPELMRHCDLVHLWQLQDPHETLAALRWCRRHGLPAVVTPLLADRTALCKGRALAAALRADADPKPRLAAIGSERATADAAYGARLAALEAYEHCARSLRSEALQLADRVLCLSPTEADHLAGHYGVDPDKIEVTPVGAPAVGCHPARKGDQPFVLLPAARIEPLKNQLVALLALQRLPYDVIVTGAPADPGYVELCRRVATPRCLFTGLVGPATIERLMARARVVVHPSLLECASLAVLQAAAVGAANLVTTRTGSEPDYLGELPRYVDPFEPDAMAAAIADAWERHGDEASRRRQLCDQARSHTWSRAAATTAAAFAGLVSPH